MIPTIRWFRDFDGELRLQYYCPDQKQWLDVPIVDYYQEKATRDAKKD